MKTLRSLSWLNVVVLACSIQAADSQAQALADDLCNYAVEGLSLNTSKEVLDAKFLAMGWHANVESSVNFRTRKQEDTYTYTRLPPEIPPTDGYRPGEKKPRYDSSFILRIIDGQPVTLSYGHHFQSGEEFALHGIAGPLEQAQAFCTRNDSRFVLAGCNRAYPGGNVISLTMTPTNTSSAYCRVNLSAHEGSNFAYTISRITADQARALQDRTERRGR